MNSNRTFNHLQLKSWSLTLSLLLGVLVPVSSQAVVFHADPVLLDGSNTLVSLSTSSTIYSLDFSLPSDTTLLGYELPGGVSGQPDVSSLLTYGSESGIMQLAFTQPNQGIKLTLISTEWKSITGGNWYKSRVHIAADSVNNSYTSAEYFYDGAYPNPFDISANLLLSTPTVWHWLETYLYCPTSSMIYPQIILKNDTTMGNLYIDKIEMEQLGSTFNLFTTTNQVPDPNGDWNGSADTAGWIIQIPGNSIPANYNISGGFLFITFTGSTTSGLKFTGASGPGLTNTAQVTTGREAGMKMSFNVNGALTNQSNPFVLLLTAGTDTPGGTNIIELGATASINKVPFSGFLAAAFVPTQPYIYGQFIVKNDTSVQFLIDNTFLYADFGP